MSYFQLDNSKQKLSDTQTDLLNLNNEYENMTITNDNLNKKVRQLGKIHIS